MKLLLSLLFIVSISLCVQAKELRVAVGISIPPYVIKENNSGFQIELIQNVFYLLGMQVNEIVYASNRRITKLLQNKEVDAALNLQPNLPNVYYSDVIINFKNVAIALKSRDIDIKRMFDLHYKRVYGFQNAHKFLGAEFAEYAKNNPLYTETIHQLSQVRHLSEKRVDVVIADRYIFTYYKNNSKYNMMEFNYFDIFSESPRYMGFLSEEIRDTFNEGLKKFKTTQTYQELLSKYQIMDE